MTLLPGSSQRYPLDWLVWGFGGESDFHTSLWGWGFSSICTQSPSRFWTEVFRIYFSFLIFKRRLVYCVAQTQVTGEEIFSQWSPYWTEWKSSVCVDSSSFTSASKVVWTLEDLDGLTLECLHSFSSLECIWGGFRWTSLSQGVSCIRHGRCLFYCPSVQCDCEVSRQLARFCELYFCCLKSELCSTWGYPLTFL